MKTIKRLFRLVFPAPASVREEAKRPALFIAVPTVWREAA